MSVYLLSNPRDWGSILGSNNNLSMAWFPRRGKLAPWKSYVRVFGACTQTLSSSIVYHFPFCHYGLTQPCNSLKGVHSLGLIFVALFCLIFLLFLLFYIFHAKYMKEAYFDQCLVCAAPKRLLKFATVVVFRHAKLRIQN